MDINQKNKHHLKLPENARLAYQGVLFKIYTWQQKLFDGSIQTFEKAVLNDSIVIIPITKSGKFVLVKQIQPGWSDYKIGFPGGTLEENETYIEGMKRELKEETGYVVEEIKFWKMDKLIGKTDKLYVWAIGFNARKEFNTEPDKGEKVETIEVSFDELVEIITQDNFYDREMRSFLMSDKLSMEETKKLRQSFNL